MPMSIAGRFCPTRNVLLNRTSVKSRSHIHTSQFKRPMLTLVTFGAPSPLFSARLCVAPSATSLCPGTAIRPDTFDWHFHAKFCTKNSELADVDGTLIESVGEDSNKLHKEAFTEAFKQVFEIDTHIDVIQHHGGTDPLVLMRVLMEVHGVSKEKCMQRMEDMKTAMLAYYSARKERYGNLKTIKTCEVIQFGMARWTFVCKTCLQQSYMQCQ